MLVQFDSHYPTGPQRPFGLSTADGTLAVPTDPFFVSDWSVHDDVDPVRQILIVDDHPMFRAALESLVRAVCPSKPTIAVGSLLEMADAIASGNEFDCVFLDLELPDSQGLRTFQQAKSLVPETPIVVVSGNASQLVRNQCLKAGAARFIGKSIQQDAMIRTLQQILSDGPRRDAVDRLAIEQGSTSVRAARKTRPVLSARQFEILSLIAQGQSNVEISIELGIAIGTVKSHVSRLLNSLGVSSRQEAAALLCNMRGNESCNVSNGQAD